jgi:hypothetical protein
MCEILSVLPFMKRISDSLSEVTSVWTTIRQSLNDVEAFNLLLASPGLLDVVRPELIVSWTNITGAIAQYNAIIDKH